MFSKLNLYIVALCSFLLTAPVWSQSIQDSTDLTKMQESDFKAIEPTGPVTILTKGNIKDTFKGLKTTIDNSGDYSAYHEDFRYKVIEHSGNLAIQRYTPLKTCSKYLAPKGMAMCENNNRTIGRRTSIACVIPEGTKSCKSSDGGHYELTLSGLLAAEGYVKCGILAINPGSYKISCSYEPYPQKVYMWNAPVAGQ